MAELVELQNYADSALEDSALNVYRGKSLGFAMEEGTKDRSARIDGR